MKQFLLSMFALLFAGAAMAQTTIKGKVSESDGTPVSNATVFVTETKKSVKTDKDGNFTIEVPGQTANVVVSHVGFLNKPAKLTAGTAGSISLEKDVKVEEEVVINVGYGTLAKRAVSSSIASITAKDLKDIPINSAAEALNGRLAGVTATTAEGSPDADVRVRIRGGISITGDNSPLYIIDGVQVENGLSTISPQDIQTVDVLKDAAATAIYGARGANGVIVISTKSGKPGKLRVTYNGQVGVKFLPKTLAVLSPYDYVIYQSERSRGNSTDSTNFLKNFGTTWDTLNVYKNVDPVDWQDEVFGRTGVTQMHNVTASGGNKFITYNFGYTFTNDKAIVINSKYIRNLLNVKTEINPTKKLKLNIGARYTDQNVYGAGVSDTKGSSYNRLRHAVKYKPFLAATQDIDDTDPTVDPNPGNGLGLINPLQLASMEYRVKTTDAINTNISASYKFLRNFTFKSTFGYEHKQFSDRQFQDSLTSYAINAGSRKPVTFLDTVVSKTLTNSNVFTYSLKNYRGKHDLEVVAGEETYDLRIQTNSSQRYLYPLGTTHSTAFADASLGTNFSAFPRPVAKTRYTSLSFFGRLNYTFLKRYIISADLRADGASKFSPENRWGYFPAGSVAWRVKDEKFMENVKAISEFKLRAGFGTVGNNRIKDYLYLTTFNNDNRYYYGINNQAIYAFYPGSLPNPNLKWESTLSRNIGADISFLRRFDLTVDYYNNTSKDLLFNVQIAPTYGYPSQVQNVGKTRNKGWEFQLNALILKGKNNLTWNSSFNISFNKNRVEQLGQNQTTYLPPASWGVSGQTSDYIAKVGEPLGLMYGFVTDGFYTVDDFNYSGGIYKLKTGVPDNYQVIGAAQPGAIKFKDLNGDGIIDFNNDRQIIGHAAPKFTGGWNNAFTYKQWDASIFVNFSYGNDIFNGNRIEFSNGYINNSNMLAEMEGRWKVVTATGQTAQWVVGSGTTATVYGIAPDQLKALNANATIWQPIKASGAFVTHSWAVEDGSFLRINNVSLGYSLPVKNLARLHMSKLRFFATANNLHVFTKYSGYDPEVSVKNDGFTPGLDYSAYPKSRSFIFGINAAF